MEGANQKNKLSKKQSPWWNLPQVAMKAKGNSIGRITDLITSCLAEAREDLAERLAPDYARFDEHVTRFLSHPSAVSGWRVEKVAIATRHSPESRRDAERAGYIPQDIEALTRGL